jgi:hypothetical protein
VPILARWTDGRFYTAQVKKVNGDRVQIRYYDGFESEVPVADLRLR